MIVFDRSPVSHITGFATTSYQLVEKNNIFPVFLKKRRKFLKTPMMETMDVLGEGETMVV